MSSSGWSLYVLHRWLHKLLVYNITFLVSADVPDPTSSRQCMCEGTRRFELLELEHVLNSWLAHLKSNPPHLEVHAQTDRATKCSTTQSLHCFVLSNVGAGVAFL